MILSIWLLFDIELRTIDITEFGVYVLTVDLLAKILNGIFYNIMLNVCLLS